MIKKYELLLLFVAMALSGFMFAVLLLRYDSLRFDATLTAGNVVQAIATIGVGFLVASYFQRNIQADRKEKDIVLRHLDLLLEAIAEFEDYKEGGVLTKVNASLKKMSMTSVAISELVVSLKYPAQIADQCRFEEQIKKMRKLATETPCSDIKKHANKARCSSVVRDGIIQLADEKTALLDTEIQRMKSVILKAQVFVNRSP